MTLVIWILAAALSWRLRRAIRSHYQRWWRLEVPRHAARTQRRQLVDPLFPILTSRRLFT